MKLAVSAFGNNLNSQIDPRFGRCAFFLVVDSKDMSFSAFRNEGSELGGGAGVQAAQFVASKGAGVVITGNCGPKAEKALAAAGIELLTGQQGIISDIIKKHIKQEPTPADEKKTVKQMNIRQTEPMLKEPQASFYGGVGTRQGMGMGRGRGIGGGSGMRGR